MPVAPSILSAGVFPVAPTAFTDDGELDLAGQRRILDCMVDQGVDGICILANYSEQFLLADAERETLQDARLRHVAGRVPVIVTCSHFSTRIAVDRARRAAAAGAAMVMLMPPYHGAGLSADEAGVVEHFARVADAAGIPLMVQDAPLSGVTLGVALLARLARELPLVRHFKIEVPGAAAKLRALVAAGGAAIAGGTARTRPRGRPAGAELGALRTPGNATVRDGGVSAARSPARSTATRRGAPLRGARRPAPPR
jgi:dihydrodipicolinate synthase/N-acetylneuraminate lyase